MSIGCQIEDKIPPPKISTRFHDDPTLLPRSIASHPFSSNFGVISLFARRCVQISQDLIEFHGIDRAKIGKETRATALTTFDMGSTEKRISVIVYRIHYL